MVPFDFSVIEQKFRDLINEKNRLLEKLKENEKKANNEEENKLLEEKKDEKKVVDADEDFNIYILKEENLALNNRLAKLTEDLKVLEEKAIYSASQGIVIRLSVLITYKILYFLLFYYYHDV